MQKLRVRNNPKFPQYRAYNKKRFENIIKSFEKKGFNYKYPIVLNQNFKLIEGTHRFTCALYFNIPEIPVTFSEKTIDLCSDYSPNWFITNNLRYFVPYIRKKYREIKNEGK